MTTSYGLVTNPTLGLVVASSDATAKDKRLADYTCDGTADDVQIQAAIAAAPVSGCITLVGQQFYLAAGLTIAQRQLRGVGIVYLDFANSANADMLTLLTAGGAVIENLIFRGNKANQTSGRGIVIQNIGSTLQNIQVESFFSHAIELEGDGNVAYGQKLIDVSARLSGGSGFYFHGSGGHSLVRCNANNNSQRGMLFNNNAITETKMANIELDANTLQGFYGQTGSHFALSNLHLNDNGYEGMILDDVEHGAIGNMFFKNNDPTGANGLGQLRFRAARKIAASNLAIDCEAGQLSPRGIYVGDNGVTESADCTITNFNIDHPLIGITVEAGSTDIVIGDGSIITAPTPIVDSGTRTKIHNVAGYVTANSGSATVLNGTTSIAVTHGLAATPTRVQITPKENPTNAVAFWWVDTVGATQFTIHVNADPGASNLDFDWHAQVGEG